MARRVAVLLRPGIAVIGRTACVVVAVLAVSGLWPMEFLYAADKPTKSAASSNSKPKSVPEIDFAADADAEQDVDLSDLVVPVALLSKPPKASERQKFGEEMEGLINEGFDPKEKALNAAKKRFETARRIIPGDPRPYYAHGLILLSHRQSPMALDAFKAAAKQIQKPYLPALQMLVWTHAARSDMPQTLAAAIELARSLESSSGSYPVAEDRVYAAEWLGRMLGYLEGPAKTETQSARIDATVMEIAGMLTGDRQQAFVQGRQSTGERFQELTALSNLSDAKLQAELKRQVAAAGPAAEGAREELKRCTDDLKKLKVPFEQSQAEYIRDIHKSLESIRSHSSQLAQAEADVETHASPKKHAQMRGLGMAGNTTGRAGTRGAAGGRGATTGRGTGAAGSNNGKAVIRDENEGERKIREAVLANAQKQVDSLNEKIEAEQQTMEDLRQQRREAPQKFREESLSQRQALRRARYRESELSARAQAAARGQWTAETIRSQVKSLETYVPLHLDVEQTRLLQSVKYKPPQH